jgi:hypothetical protein
MLASASPARAEGLRDVAARVERAWRAAGGMVVRRDPRFVMEDETTTVDLRPAASAREGDCRRVVLIGTRGMSFHVTAAEGTASDSFRASSVAGVLELPGCTVPDWVKVKSDSGRGALETLIATAAGPLPPAVTIILERTGGVLPPPPEPGPLPPLLPPGARASQTEERLSREGLAIRPELTWTAGSNGKGTTELTLDEGCHRLDLFAVEPRSHETGRHAHLDVDGALRRADGELLAEDQSSAPDVRLETCVGTTTKVNATFEGAPRDSSVIVTHGFRPIPPHVPRVWGPGVRARLASVILEHHVAGPTDDAIVLAQGAAGPTAVPIDLEPGGCYLAVAALERGRSHGHGLSMHAVIGERIAEDERGAKEEAAIVGFCARDADHGRVEVDTRSTGAGWAVAVFRMSGGAWDVGP